MLMYVPCSLALSSSLCVCVCVYVCMCVSAGASDMLSLDWGGAFSIHMGEGLVGVHLDEVEYFFSSTVVARGWEIGRRYGEMALVR